MVTLDEIKGLSNLSVDDRIQIALKVADRRLNSIRSTRNLLEVFPLGSDLSARVSGRRGSIGEGAPMTSRRASFSGGRSLIGVTSRTAFPPPDDFRISHETLPYN